VQVVGGTDDPLQQYGLLELFCGSEPSTSASGCSCPVWPGMWPGLDPLGRTHHRSPRPFFRRFNSLAVARHFAVPLGRRRHLLPPVHRHSQSRGHRPPTMTVPAAQCCVTRHSRLVTSVTLGWWQAARKSQRPVSLARHRGQWEMALASWRMSGPWSVFPSFGRFLRWRRGGVGSSRKRTGPRWCRPWTPPACWRQPGRHERLDHLSVAYALMVSWLRGRARPPERGGR
jgi:hypothetical protein